MPRDPLETSRVVARVREDLPVAHRATTSRALLDNEAARVVAFTFDAGEQLTEHTAAVPVVVQIIEGRVRFELEGADHELSAGDVVYLAPGAPHALEALEPSRLSLVMLHRRA